MLKSYSSNILKVFLLVFTLIPTAFAGSNDAESFVKNIGQETIAIVKLDVDDKEKEAKLVKLFDGAVDTKWMARFVAGKNWNDTTEEQKEKYTELYRKYLISTYVPEFKSYSNESLKYNGSSQEYDNEFLVKTEIISPTNQTYRINYKVRKLEDGSFKVFDIIAEGVSLLTTQRSEFGSVISRKNFDYLIKILEKKTS